VLFRECRRRKLPPEFLVEGISYDLSHLKDPHEWVSWADWVRVIANSRAVFSESDFERLGADTFRAPVFRIITVIARLLYTTNEFYRWAYSEDAPKRVFRSATTKFVELKKNRVAIEVTLPADYPQCPELFFLTRGGLMQVPCVYGLAAADVHMTEIPNGMRYDVTFPIGGGALAWLRRAIAWPFTARAVARELRSAHGALQARYEELDQARKTLTLQASQISTAHKIGEIIHGDLDLDRTLGAVANALVHAGGFAGCEVEIAVDVEDQYLERSARAGAAEPHDGTLELRLDSHGRDIGRLRLWPTPPPERRELLDSVLPTISMAIDNAITHRALVDYRQNLELKVADRTAELRQARDALAATVERLQEAQAARDRIFANINHELRTPLSLIMLAVADLKKGARLDAQAIGQLDGVELGARKLLRLVNELLLLAAAHEQKLTVKLTSADLAAMLTDAVARWSRAAEARGLELSYTGPTRCCLHFDVEAIERVVTNLLSNALKFTPSGGSVQIELAQSEREVTVSVRDTGIGIDEEFKTRIFGRFEQGRPALHSSARGSGLGLSLAKELMEAHGGTIAVETPRAGGSIFRITLPLRSTRTRSPVLGVPRPERAGALGPADYGLESPFEGRPTIVGPQGPAAATILVAEDDPELCDAIARLLGDHYRVFTAPDGLSALRLAQQHLPDLLVSDVGMPGMDGLDLTRRFRELPGNRLAPVLLLTAFGDLRNRLEGFDAGAVDYVIKPFEADELKARVRSQLQLRSLALRLHQTEKLAALGTLSAGLAHEMRNPANAIVNAVEPLVEQLPPSLTQGDGPVAQLLQVLRECAGQIAVLSRQLLGFKRPGELERQDVAFSDLVSRALGVTQKALRSVEVRQEGTYDGPIHCAAPLLVQVLTNLLENAAYAAGTGGWVRIATRATSERLIVEFSDSGPGVPRDLRERIFEPFFTTKPPGAGTGLGLTTSREIAMRHGGLLDVRDLPNGSVFHLEIPLGRAQPRAAVQSGAAS